MIVRKLRIQKGWSQEHLATISGLSVRTIQRIERGQSAGLESMNALAAVFEVQLNELIKEPQPMTQAKHTQEELEAIEYVRDIKGFYGHLLSYVITIVLLAALNLLIMPGYLWFIWVALGWGIGVLTHGMSVFELFNFIGADWEKRQVEKRLGRKL